ncbi:MAG: hypothetical protein AAF328_00515 [Planctomycetota bacterium]
MSVTRWTSTISICLLIWLIPFLTVIAPGHQRGVLKTPGSQGALNDVATIAAPGCALCAFVAGFGDKEAPDRPTTPTSPGGDCAICHFNGTLLNPPPFALPNLKPQPLSWPAQRRAVAIASNPPPIARLSGRAPPNTTDANS